MDVHTPKQKVHETSEYLQVQGCVKPHLQFVNHLPSHERAAQTVNEGAARAVTKGAAG
jgi:hypothetical protein